MCISIDEAFTKGQLRLILIEESVWETANVGESIKNALTETGKYG